MAGEEKKDKKQPKAAGGKEPKSPKAPKGAKGEGKKGGDSAEAEAGERISEGNIVARLHQRYLSEILPELQGELGIANRLAVPKLEKIVVSMGTGSPQNDKTRGEAAAGDLTKITGQKPQVRVSKKAVSNFKLREGMEVGLKVTLRGKRMYEFLDRLINTAAPRIRDFRGLNPRSFDGQGNYSMGVSDQSIFPEIDSGRITHAQGMNITMVTSAQSDAQARALLTKLGMPFRREEQSN